MSCTNPTSGSDVSDAGGWFPQIFAAEGTVVDITLKDSAGVTVKTYEDATFVGSDTGDFTRTVSGNGRVKITGSAGSVLFQAGDPANDNTGGTLTIEGWAGSQLDSLTLDAATTNLTGPLTVIGKKLPGVVQVDATSFSGATNVDIPLSDSPTGVRAYYVRIFDLLHSGTAAVSVIVRFSYDGGATYKTGASDYGYASLKSDIGTTAGVAAGAATGTGINFPLTTATDRPADLEIRIVTPNSGTQETTARIEYQCLEAGGSNPMIASAAGYGRGGYGRATHMRMTVVSGTWTGKYRVVAEYGTGDA